MNQATKSGNELIQELFDSLTQQAEEASKRKQTASTKFEYYKFEFADGEKHAFEDAAKKLKAILGKI